jgi:serine/threonine protein kinase
MVKWRRYINHNKQKQLWDLTFVTDFDLGKFYDEVLTAVLDNQDENQIQSNRQHANCIQAMWSFFACLSDALRYIHSCATKHLDIKPGNILVKKHPSYPYGHRVYIADFGISRCFPTLDHSQTGAEILRTPKYCAPEVWNRKVHGRAADIFSLGCVFTEMLTVLAGRDLDEFSDFRIHGEERSSVYHATLNRVLDWIEDIRLLLSDHEFYRCFLTVWRPIEINASQFPDWVVKEDGIGAIVRMVSEDSKLRTLPTFVFSDMTFTTEYCSSCTEAREVYRED